MNNLAHKFAGTVGGIAVAREQYDGACIDFAGDLEDFLGKGRLAYFDAIFHPEWRYHCALEIDGLIHDLWQERPMPMSVFMDVIGASEVEYPAEVAT